MALPHSNIPELSVSELSGALKKRVEEDFARVRIRGEVSQPKWHSSGHLYLSLKDENATLAAVCWKGVAQRLRIRPEEGMEVIAEGRITTYAMQSKYQLVIDQVSLAGVGALLKLLEDRKKKLAAEGLFDAARKKPIPYLPHTIGVITSPTGAVIRDILHRIDERFPRRVILWPVNVQGEGAATQIASAIAGFNALEAGGAVPRPDVIIVARGGGALEDLMAFNEEVVVRAAAASRIPLISAVGHETDTTLIDFASDKRAPTPTAAAEMAVPVRAELLGFVADRAERLEGALFRLFDKQKMLLGNYASRLVHPRALIETLTQRLDDQAERLQGSVLRLFGQRRLALGASAGRLVHPRALIEALSQRLGDRFSHLGLNLKNAVAMRATQLHRKAAGLSLAPLRQSLRHGAQKVDGMENRLRLGFGRIKEREEGALGHFGAMLESLSYQSILKRGYAMVSDESGAPVMAAQDVKNRRDYKLTFADGVRTVIARD